MTWPEVSFTVVVVGDIIIDHDILVRRSALLHAEILGKEIPYEVERRYTTVGGAGGSARLLAMINGGDTFLAGFSAPTMWGQAMAETMEGCRTYDNSPRPVKLLCVWTAEGRGAVVSRLVELGSNDAPRERLSRWDDSARFTLPSYKRQALPDWIIRTHRNSPLDGILLADLNRGTVDEEMVSSIANFASEEGLPLVVVPKWISGMYRSVTALALIPNLTEWCQLVKGDEEDMNDLNQHFRQGLGRPDRLAEMAGRSIRNFPGFSYHIITCDSDGLVLIGPVKEGVEIPVSRLAAVEIDRSIKKGAGDVFSAQFLLAYLYHRNVQQKTESEAVHDACRRGTAAAAAHLVADWHRMPTLDEVEQFALRVGELTRVAEGTWPIEIVWDTLGDHISLDEMATSLPGIFTSNEDYRRAIEGIWEHLDAQTGTPEPRGLLIGAPSGDGKSALLDALALASPARDYDGFAKELAPEALAKDLGELAGATVIIDEADKAASYIRTHIHVVEEAIKAGTVFIFAGTGFSQEQSSDPTYAELFNRCKPFFPKRLAERATDVAVILAAKIVELLREAGFKGPEVDVERPTLDAAIRNTVLAKTDRWSGKHLMGYAREIVGDLSQKKRTGRSQQRSVARLSHPSHRDESSPVVRVVAQSS